MTFLALLVTALTWAHFAILDEVKRGNGKVVPSRQTQVVQTLEGGIVGDILWERLIAAQRSGDLPRLDGRGVAPSDSGIQPPAFPLAQPIDERGSLVGQHVNN